MRYTPFVKNKPSLRAPTRTLSCPCGAPVIVDGRRPAGSQVCVVCRQSLEIVVSTDPRTRKRTIGILVRPEAVTTRTQAVRPAGAPKRAKTRVPAGTNQPRCACGARVAVDLGVVDAVYGCPGCGACYTAVAKADGKTGPAVPHLIRVDAPPVEAPDTRSFALSPDVIGAQPVRTRGQDVWILCFCGRELPVESEATRQDRRCPGCGLSFQLVLAVEPGTHRAMAITLPRSKAASKTQTA
jgi:hypothetical protein